MVLLTGKGGNYEKLCIAVTKNVTMRMAAAVVFPGFLVAAVCKNFTPPPLVFLRVRPARGVYGDLALNVHLNLTTRTQQPEGPVVGVGQKGA